MGDGVNLIGFLSANLGLGVAARNTLALLRRKGIPVAGLDIEARMGRSGHAREVKSICVPDGNGLPHGINLWHLNPPEISNLMATGRLRIDWDRFNVCVPFWELTCLPGDWFQALDAMDLVLAPSRFIASTLAAQLESARVRHYPQILELPEPAGWDRQALGIPPDDLVFATSFDFGSSLERKNPLGALKAFLQEFKDSPRVHLLVKANNAGMNEGAGKVAALLKERFGGHGNIHILDRPMSYPEVLALYRCADAYVSLHRAEGLGLGMMESMSLGKAVIGTGWSGNMEFMRDGNSCLVRHRLVPVDAEAVYGRMMRGRDAVWAEPDLADASRWMRRLAGDPELRRDIGGRAAEAIRLHNAEAGKGRALDEMRLCRERWESGPESGRESGAFRRRPAPAWSLPGEEPPRKASKVTAIVSTYNSERFIRGCLQNLVEQTLFAEGRLEIVVVDSGSTQGEGAVVAEYRARHPGIVYLRTGRETLYAAWNRAVEAAGGDYLVNANTDDRHRPDAFARMAAALDVREAGLVYADALLTAGANETFASHTAARRWLLPDFNVRQALADCPFGCVVMWRKTLHGELGPFDPAYRIVGDYEFFLKASLARGAYHLPEELCLYYVSDQNLSYRDQSQVDGEVERFLGPARVSTPLETIYPFLREDASRGARIAAAMDFAALLLNPASRVGPKEALARLQALGPEAGGIPEVANNMAIALLYLERQEEARRLMNGILHADPGQASALGLGGPEGPWVPGRIIRLRHPGLDAMPEVILSKDTRPVFEAGVRGAHFPARRAETSEAVARPGGTRLNPQK